MSEHRARDRIKRATMVSGGRPGRTVPRVEEHERIAVQKRSVVRNNISCMVVAPRPGFSCIPWVCLGVGQPFASVLQGMVCFDNLT